MVHTRFAVYYLPRDGALAAFGAAWLGWNAAAGEPVEQPNIPGIVDATKTPRKYGFHATLKPPFRLANGFGLNDLAMAIDELARTTAKAESAGLEVAALGRFLALTPVGDTAGISRVAKACVTVLDRYRAPLNDTELARRRARPLSDRQDALLTRWGYPFVLEEFRFHMTLTGKLPKADVPHWMDQVAAQHPPLPEPFVLDQIALVGERADGLFELIQRYDLTA